MQPDPAPLDGRPVKILVSGSRHFTDRAYIYRKLDTVAEHYAGQTIEIIEGAAPGADRICREWAEERGHRVQTFYARWIQDGRRVAGPQRNQRMVNYGAALALFFPLPGSRGTHDCRRKAKAAKIPDVLFDYVAETAPHPERLF